MPVYQNRIQRLYRRIPAAVSEAEHQLWRKLRGRQVLGVQFYRQRPLGDYLMNFYAYKVELGIEVHTGQVDRVQSHESDVGRDVLCASPGLKLLSFDDFQVLNEINVVIGEIHCAVRERLASGQSLTTQ